MTEDLFTELLESVREGGAILRGEKEPSRKFEIKVCDVQSIGKRYDLAQREFEGDDSEFCSR